MGKATKENIYRFLIGRFLFILMPYSNISHAVVAVKTISLVSMLL